MHHLFVDGKKVKWIQGLLCSSKIKDQMKALSVKCIHVLVPPGNRWCCFTPTQESGCSTGARTQAGACAKNQQTYSSFTIRTKRCVVMLFMMCVVMLYL